MIAANFQYALWGPSVVNSVKEDAVFMRAADDALSAVALLLYNNSTEAIPRLSTDAITVHNKFIRAFSNSLNRNGIYIRGSSADLLPMGAYWRHFNHHGQPRFHRVTGEVTTEFVQCSGKRFNERILVSHIGPARVEFVAGSQLTDVQPALDLSNEKAPEATNALRSNVLLVTEVTWPHLLLWACHPNGVLNREECWIHTDASELVISKKIQEIHRSIDLRQQPQATTIDLEVEEIEDVGT